MRPQGCLGPKVACRPKSLGSSVTASTMARCRSSWPVMDGLSQACLGAMQEPLVSRQLGVRIWLR